MSEPNDRDREVAHAFNLERARPDGWPVLVVSAYREECVRAERERVLAVAYRALLDQGFDRDDAKCFVFTVVARLGSAP